MKPDFISTHRADITWYLLLVLLCAVFCIATLGLSSGLRLDVPFTYDGDGLEYNLMTKTMIETGWWLENPRTGAPGTLQLYDYAVGGNLDFVVMKIISLFTSEYGLIMNLYYILGFFLTAIISMWVLRTLRIEYGPALLGSLLYTFLYYHFARIGHYNLTAYYLVPLAILAAIRIAGNEEIWVRGTGWNLHPVLSGWGVCAFLSLFLVSTNPYYGFFSLLFLAVATLWAVSRTGAPVHLVNGIVAGFFVILGTLINKLPSLIYEAGHGASFVLSYRYPFESEIWGMKLIQLLLPVPGHRIPFLADIAAAYTQFRPLVNENSTAALGIVGSAGLIFLLAWVFIRNYKPVAARVKEFSGLFDILSLLTISGILIGTIGGISAIIAQVFPTIHSYNRISLFIAFFCITAIMILIQVIAARFREAPYFSYLFPLILLLILVGGIYDQVPAGYTQMPGSDREQKFISDEQFFGSLDTLLPPGSAVFILPDIGGFPHSTPPGRIGGLDSMKPYLHTQNLTWSYPTMKGRVWDNWQSAVAFSSPDLIPEILVKAGFSGLLVDCYGYDDNGTAIMAVIGNTIQTEPVRSPDGRYAFYTLIPYKNTKYGSIPEEQYRAEVDLYLAGISSMPELQDPLFASDLRKQVKAG